jgi:hypothetical protein
VDSRGRPIGTDGPDQTGAYPFDPVHGGPVDQVHRRRSTGYVSLASALRQPGHSQLTTCRHLSFPAGRPDNFANKPPFLEFTKIAFHLIKEPFLFFWFRP